MSEGRRRQDARFPPLLEHAVAPNEDDLSCRVADDRSPSVSADCEPALCAILWLMSADSRCVSVLATAGLLAVLVGCGGGGGVEPYGLNETEPGVLQLFTSCAQDLSVDVDQTADEVRISDVDGESIDGDCLGAIEIELTAPLEGRRVAVHGERWVELPAACGWSIGHPDLGDRFGGC